MRPSLIAIGPFDQYSGYGVFATGLIAALERRMPVVRIYCAGPDDLSNARRRLGAVTDGSVVPAIAFLPPPLAKPLLRGRHPSICCAFFETTALPAGWAAAYAAMDRVWIASTWGRDVLVGQGIAPERIDLVPGGVDTTLFTPEGPKVPALADDARFKFLSVGAWSTRKGTYDLARVFDRYFPEDAPVRLVLACHNPYVPGFSQATELARIEPLHPERITLIPSLPSQAHLAALYRSCDAFVLPTRGEGFGLPILEAMASGLPVAATDWSAPADFVTPDIAIPLRHRIEPAHAPLTGDWAVPEVPHLAETLLGMAEHQGEAAACGKAARAHVVGGWTWDHAALAALRALERVGGQNPR